MQSESVEGQTLDKTKIEKQSQPLETESLSSNQRKQLEPQAE